jgi:hypothetical protein
MTDTERLPGEPLLTAEQQVVNTLYELGNSIKRVASAIRRNANATWQLEIETGLALHQLGEVKAALATDTRYELLDPKLKEALTALAPLPKPQKAVAKAA